MSARSRAAAAAAMAAFAIHAGAKELVDQCVGGKWDELLAQSGIVHSRKFPELGLSEKLAFECPSFVNQVLSAESLDAPAKRRIFSEAASWPHEKVQVFYLKLRLENQKRQDEFWGKRPSGANPETAGKAR